MNLLRKHRPAHLLSLLLAAFSIVSVQGRAAPAPKNEKPGITVMGTGEARAKPNLLEIDLASTGSAELTGDALVKYRDSIKRTIEAFEHLGNKNLKIEQRGLGVQTMDVNSGNRFNGGNAGPTKMQIDICGDLKLTVSGADKMTEDELTEVISKLVDTAKDSGATVGGGNSAASIRARMYGESVSSSVVSFVLDDISALREQARKKAFKQAEGRAKQLAELSGVTLGPVVSIEESIDSQPTNERQRILATIYGWGGDEEDSNATSEGRVMSEKLGEIPVRVSLKVRFSIKES